MWGSLMTTITSMVFVVLYLYIFMSNLFGFKIIFGLVGVHVLGNKKR